MCFSLQVCADLKGKKKKKKKKKIRYTVDPHMTWCMYNIECQRRMKVGRKMEEKKCELFYLEYFILLFCE